MRVYHPIESKSIQLEQNLAAWIPYLTVAQQFAAAIGLETDKTN